MLGAVQGFREEIVAVLRRRPGLKGKLDELFEAGCRAGFLKAAGKLTTDDREREDLAAWMQANSGYSYEQVVTFDPRPATPRPDGTLAGRGMDDGLNPNTSTWPPAVARKLNAGLKDLRRPFPILDDPGRMARDAPGVRYERMAESGPPGKRPEATKRTAPPPPSQPGIQPGGLAAQAAPDHDR